MSGSFLLRSAAAALVLFAGLPGAGAPPAPSAAIARASASFKAKRDLPSLRKVAAHLRKGGRTRGQVEALLGQPDYCPTEFQAYYASRRQVRIPGLRNKVPFGLVVGYRSAGPEVPEGSGERVAHPGDAVESLELMAIGE